MFIDASAVVAMLTAEPEADQFADQIQRFGPAITSPLAIVESVLAIRRKQRRSFRQSRADVKAFLEAARVDVIEVTARDGELALSAYEQYGKGMGHPAQLNFGDCFAYAIAKNRDIPLLFKGNDFSKTDIGRAPPSVAF